jgi:hypothetical protein
MATSSTCDGLSASRRWNSSLCLNPGAPLPSSSAAPDFSASRRDTCGARDISGSRRYFSVDKLPTCFREKGRGGA